MDALNWHKASYSAANGGCVEVADHDHRVLVRDTQDRAGPVLTMSPAAWRRFADRVKRSLPPSRWAADLPAVLVAITTKTAGKPGRQAWARMDLAQFEAPYVVAV